MRCGHPPERVAVYARRLLDDGLSACEHICTCGKHWWSVGIAPQQGPQTAFFSSDADIVFFGGGAGGGKSWSQAIYPTRYFDDPRFNAIIFRRTTGELKGAESIWSETLAHYPRFGARSNTTELSWALPAGGSVKLSHLQHALNTQQHQSKAYAGIHFEELPHFLESQFWYLLSRSRSLSHVRAYVRATMNPVPASDPVGGWVRRLVDWWIDADGYAIPERSGVVRWFYRRDDQLHWSDSREELEAQHPEMVDTNGRRIPPKSFTFIPATLDDNKILRDGDPGYEANLHSLQSVERLRLRKGNWNIAPAAGLYFQRGFFEVVDKPCPRAKVIRRARGWDLAASKPTPENPDPSWTRGVLMAIDSDGGFWLEDVVSLRGSPGQVRALIQTTAQQDGPKVVQACWQDPGQAGKAQAQELKRMLPGHVVRTLVAKEDKITYASPLSTQAEAQNVKVVRGEWNGSFFSEAEAFPEGKHADQIDAASRAFSELDTVGMERWRKALENR